MANEIECGSDLISVLRKMTEQHGGITVAVSGGVDSMTLASLAHRQFSTTLVRMVHAMSPAVPVEAGQRVQDLSAKEGWRIDIVDAGEFADPSYRSNPVNRCFFCKSNLYGTLSRMSDGLVVSGANLDDLGDYRPGLDAAANHGVRHPYVEAGLTKQEVRELAKELGLAEYAALPSSPCLSSRVETGLPINANELALIDAVEQYCRAHLNVRTVRCRRRRTGFVIEVDAEALANMNRDACERIVSNLRETQPMLSLHPLSFAPYVRGSAFVGKPADVQ